MKHKKTREGLAEFLMTKNIAISLLIFFLQWNGQVATITTTTEPPPGIDECELNGTDSTNEPPPTINGTSYSHLDCKKDGPLRVN